MSQEQGTLEPEFPGEPQQTTSSERLSIGKGYAIEWNTATILTVYRYGVPYKTTQINAGIDRRRLAVELVLECGVSKRQLAEALHASRQSIDNWLETFRKAGFEGLLTSTKTRSSTTGPSQRPTGNKARQLEAAHKQQREEAHRQQLCIEFAQAEAEKKECGDESEHAEAFNETYEFQENRYAGGFLYWGIFQHRFGVMELCDSFYGKFSTVVYLFAMMLVHRIQSVEQLKTVFKREFGRLLGLKQLWSKPLLWNLIHSACALKRSLGFVQGFFHRQARKGVVAVDWLYVDGHFVPYYGQERVHQGYYTQRAQMMPGQTEMYVHDVCGQIVYAEIQEGKGDLKEMMHRMSEEWAAYIGGRPPFIIVDREGWGVQHFLSLSLKGYRYVTWEKFSEAEKLAAIPEEAFGPAFTMHETLYQTYEEQKVYRDTTGQSVTLRRIVIWNTQTDHRVACVTPNEVQEDRITVACAMLGRWGCSENSFKHMGTRWNMHYNPVIDASQDSEQQDIVNPEYRNGQQTLKRLKTRLARCERDLGKLPLTTKKDGSLRTSKKRDRLQQERIGIKEQIAEVAMTLKACPERLTLPIEEEETNPDSAQRFKVLDREGKNLWNVAQALVWNSRKQLLDLVSMSLPNIRDQIPLLEAMTQGRGWVRSTPEAIEVRLESLETPRFHATQIQLCRALNDMEIRFSNGKRLLYDVGPEPGHVQKNCL